MSSSIRVNNVVLHRVRVPLVEPFRISNGVVAEKDAVLIELATDAGTVGWGEASPMSGSFYSDATPDSSWAALSERLVPALLAAGDVDPGTFFEFLREQPADQFAKAGIEGALWDAYANTRHRALYELFGIERRPVPSGVAIGIFETIAELIERVSR